MGAVAAGQGLTPGASARAEVACAKRGRVCPKIRRQSFQIPRHASPPVSVSCAEVVWAPSVLAGARRARSGQGRLRREPASNIDVLPANGCARVRHVRARPGRPGREPTESGEVLDSSAIAGARRALAGQGRLRREPAESLQALARNEVGGARRARARPGSLLRQPAECSDALAPALFAGARRARAWQSHPCA